MTKNIGKISALAAIILCGSQLPATWGQEASATGQTTAPGAQAAVQPDAAKPKAERSAEFAVVTGFFAKCGKNAVAYALAHPEEFAAALKNAEAIRQKDGKQGRRTAYGLYIIYEKFLAGGGAPIAGVASPADFHRATDPARYWRNRATPEELLSEKKVPFGMRYSSAGRFSGEVRTKTQLAIFQQSLGTGQLDPQFCKLVREHVATLSDSAAETLLKAEIRELAKLPSGKERDAVVNDYLGILAIRRELAAATK